MTDRLHIGNRYLSYVGLDWYDNTARMHDPLLMRFTSPDPLASKYPGLSPWAHTAVNPVNLIDPDGKEWKIITQAGNNGETDVNMSVTGVVLNMTTEKIEVEELSKKINEQLNSIYTFKSGKYNVTMVANIRIAKSFGDLKQTDHVIRIWQPGYFRNENILANAINKGLIINSSTTLVNQTINNKNNTSFAHEFGHTAGLHDVNLNNNLNVADVDHNLMTQSATLIQNWIDRNDATKIEPSQLNAMITNFNAGKLNQSLKPANIYSSFLMSALISLFRNKYHLYSNL